MCSPRTSAVSLTLCVLGGVAPALLCDVNQLYSPLSEDPGGFTKHRGAQSPVSSTFCLFFVQHCEHSLAEHTPKGVIPACHIFLGFGFIFFNQTFLKL